MEHRAPRAYLALLWGWLLGAAAAQGMEGECARGGRPGPAQPGRPDRRTSAPPEPGAPLRVRLWKPTWRRPVRRAEVGRATGLRSGLNWDPRLVM